MEVRFLDADGEEVARNAQPVNIVPGKFGRQLVKGEMKYEDYGTIEAHVRLVGGRRWWCPSPCCRPPREPAVRRRPLPASVAGGRRGRGRRPGPRRPRPRQPRSRRPPDLALLFVTPPHAGALEDAAGPSGDCSAPAPCSAAPPCRWWAAAGRWSSARRRPVGGHDGRRSRPSTSPWSRHPDGQTVTGWPDDDPRRPQRPAAPPRPVQLPGRRLPRSASTRTGPACRWSGGMASAARGPGGNRLVIDDRVVTAGAVGRLPARRR